MTALGPAPGPASTGAQHVHWPAKRARLFEKALAVFLLLTVLAITVVLLGLQWLGNQSTAVQATMTTSRSLFREVQPS